MDKNTDFIEYFAELTEQVEKSATDKNDKYLELGDTNIFTYGWERYRILYDGVWDSDAGCIVDRDIKKATTLLDNLYKRLQPHEDDIVSEYEQISWPLANDAIWMRCAYDICREYHRQAAVTAMVEPQQIRKKRPGRPTRSIREYILSDDKENLLDSMHSLIDEKKGKEAVLIIMASVAIGYMTKPSYNAITDEFGKLCSSSRYNKIMKDIPLRSNSESGIVYQNSSIYTNQEIESAIGNLSL